jgi:hypothetical protein
VRQSSVSPKGSPAVETQRPLKYQLNGSGRDTYIYSNNGGFTSHGNGASNLNPTMRFQHNLRGYRPDDTYL